MATRATYTFKGNDERGDVNLYIHYDGYPEGASAYFEKTLDLLKNDSRESLRQLRGGMAEQFIRANYLASFTTHPDDHGDTEYHYEFNDDGWIVKAYKGYVDNRKEFFSGGVREFIKQYSGERHAN